MVWQKGQSGNSGGRPKHKPLSEALMLMIKRDANLVLDPKKDLKTNADKIAYEMVCKAKDGDIQAARECFDRIEGKASQEIDMNIAETPQARVYPAGIDEKLEETENGTIN